VTPTLVHDELYKQLVAVGQVDVIVGLPTYNNAATAAHVARAVHQAFGGSLLRERTTLINLDAGSIDGTPEIVSAVGAASSDDGPSLTARHYLRTAHRVRAPYHGVPGKGAAIRTLFAAADLLQARAVAVLAPDVTNVTPAWIESLVRPVLRGSAEFVTPIFARHPLDAPLVTQLVRPVMRAVYGPLVYEPLAVEFGCSARFATERLADPVWDGELGRTGIDVWLTAAALAGRLTIDQPVLGSRTVEPGGARPSLPELFQQVMGALLMCLELHEPSWLEREEVSPECRSLLAGDHAAPPAVDVDRLIEAFARDARSLLPVVERIVTPQTLAGIAALVEMDAARFVYPDELWVTTVYDFAAGYHRTVMNRQHVMQALVPLYLGRVASFFREHASQDPQYVTERLDTVCRAFEQARPRLVEGWTHTG
jgi:hypothetical protein